MKVYTVSYEMTEKETGRLVDSGVVGVYLRADDAAATVEFFETRWERNQSENPNEHCHYFWEQLELEGL